MKELYTLLVAFLFATGSFAQTTVFSDDFESGLGSWTLTGQWGLSNTQVFNGANALADSPAGLYANMQTSFATITNSFDLSNALDANVHMQVKYDIENGFDYCYLEMSDNNGSTWTTIYTFNGENFLTNWTDLTVNAGGFAGNSQVKLRFRFYTDAFYQADGIFIDSFRIVSDTVDNAPPLIVHDPDPHFEGQIDTNFRAATITDISGIATAILSYTVDNGAQQTISPYDTNGNVYTFAIPPQQAGAYVNYLIYATDSSPAANTAFSEVFEYVAGNYIKHDNAVVSTVANFTSSGTLNGVANRITLDGLSTLTTALIRNYVDINNPTDSIEVHVWSNNNGVPGSDLITPFNVFPEASLLTPQRMTRVDLRPLAAQLDSLEGEVFIGFEVPQGSAWVCQTTGSNGRGYTLNSSNNWSAATTTYHFRAVTSEPAYAPDANFSYNNSTDPSIDFTDLSTNTPSSWYWDFGDGDTSSLQHPSHTFANVGSYQVCLTAANGVGASTPYCEQVVISNGPPIASFNPELSNDPSIFFDENSQHNPTSWNWDFGDGATSTLQAPTHTYQVADDYNVCLIASNTYGSDTTCQTVSIDNQLPIPLFDFDVLPNNIVTFNNQSAPGNPPQTFYTWYLGTGIDSSNAFEPTHVYPRTGGMFEVCLKASNAIGTAPLYCADLELENLVVGLSEQRLEGVRIMPNPASDLVLIKLPEHASMTALQILSADGKLIELRSEAVQGGIQINVQWLPKGIYFVKLTTASGSVNRLPLIVQ